MKAKAVVFAEQGRVELRDFVLPDPEAGEVIVETDYSCISPGTELRCLRGAERNAKPFPFIPGYALAGRVLRVGPGVNLREGARVASMGTQRADGVQVSWGGQVSCAVCAAQTLVPIPPEVDSLSASMTTMAAIAYHGMRLARPLAGERVAVIGLGLIGQLCARLYGLAGADVVACDTRSDRVETARSDRVRAVLATKDLCATVRDALPNGADIVVDATGAPAVLEQAVRLAADLPWDDTPAPGPRLLVQGSYEGSVPLPYVDTFNRELTVMVPRSQQRHDRVAVMDLMRRGLLDTRGLISGVHRPEQAADAYARLADGGGSCLTMAFQWIGA